MTAKGQEESKPASSKPEAVAPRPEPKDVKNDKTVFGTTGKFTALEFTNIPAEDQQSIISEKNDEAERHSGDKPLLPF